MKRLFFLLALTLTLLIFACSKLPQPEQISPTPAPFSTTIFLAPTATPTRIPRQTPTPTDDPVVLSLLFPGQGTVTAWTRTDNQGMVMVEVTPRNLGMSIDTLEFNIAMNTHSVDLSMDLTLLSTLTTNTGVVIQPALWDAPRGGHHISGKLIFPIVKDGAHLLDGVTKIILQIHNVNVPVRTFEWNLDQP